MVTPNIQEAERITGVSIRGESDIEKAGAMMQSLGAKNVLIKGGHFEVETRIKQKARDYLFTAGQKIILEADYIETTATHGTGCVLSSAIAANLALGKDLKDAVSISKSFVNEAIRTAPNLGHGHSPINIQRQ